MMLIAIKSIYKFIVIMTSNTSEADNLRHTQMKMRKY